MIERRRLLGLATSIGLATGLAPGRILMGQEPATAPKPKVILPDDDRINRILEPIRTGGRRLPGMVGAIVLENKLSAIGASGFRKVGSNAPIQSEDLIHLGSCTKAMTATLLGLLVDEGKLGWETTVGDLFGRGPLEIHPDFRKVTLRQLLGHRGGFGHDLAWRSFGRDSNPSEERLRLLSQALQAPPSHRPGTYEYSNVGFVLAGLMAEEVTQTSWEDLIRRRLFAPLGMTTGGFGVPGNPGRVDQPWGHRLVGDELRPIQLDNPRVMGPAGTIHCSMADWAKFALLHLGQGRLLRPETLEALHQPRAGEDYVGGWMVMDRSWAGGQALTHSGSNTTWYATIWLAPARNFAVLAATNAGGDQARDATDEAIQGLLRLIPNSRGRRR